MPSTIAEVDKLFAGGADSVTLTRAEWEAICEIRGIIRSGWWIGVASRRSLLPCCYEKAGAVAGFL